MVITCSVGLLMNESDYQTENDGYKSIKNNSLVSVHFRAHRLTSLVEVCEVFKFNLTKMTLMFCNRGRVFWVSARCERWDVAMDSQAAAGEVRQPEPGSASSR